MNQHYPLGLRCEPACVHYINNVVTCNCASCETYVAHYILHIYLWSLRVTRWAASFEYGNLCRSRPVTRRRGSVGGSAAAANAAADGRSVPPALAAARHSTDKQQKNAILNDAGGFATLVAVEVRVYRRHGEDN